MIAGPEVFAVLAVLALVVAPVLFTGVLVVRGRLRAWWRRVTGRRVASKGRR